VQTDLVLASTPEVPLRDFALATLVTDDLSLAGKAVIIGTIVASTASRHSISPTTPTAVSVERAVDATGCETYCCIHGADELLLKGTKVRYSKLAE
jgi:hypothetical protein